MIICYPASYVRYWWSMKSLIGMADPIHHLIIFSMRVMIWMKERSNIYVCQYGWPSRICQNHACICALQISGFAGLPALHLSNQAVCICRHWFQRFFWSSAGFLPKLFQYFSSQPSAFSDRWYPHLLFSSLLIIGTFPAHFHSALPTEQLWRMKQAFILQIQPLFCNSDTHGKRRGK